MDGWQRRYRLSNGPGGLGVSCAAEGLALAGVPLLAKGAGGFRVRPAAEVETLLRRAYASREPGAAVLPGLTKIADALNRGDVVQAMIRAVHLRLAELDWDAAVRLAQANDNLAKYSPDQPRDWHGRWTDGGGGEGPAPELEGHGRRGLPINWSATPGGKHHQVLRNIHDEWPVRLKSRVQFWCRRYCLLAISWRLGGCRHGLKRCRMRSKMNLRNRFHA
jgi:hypothetical protein